MTFAAGLIIQTKAQERSTATYIQEIKQAIALDLSFTKFRRVA